MKAVRLCGLLALALIALVAMPPVALARANAALEVLFNGEPSTVKVQETEAGAMVPVGFAVPDSGHREQYSVWIETDTSGKTVKVTRVRKQPPRRGAGDCRWCKGSALCQDCYPAGSRVNTAGLPCIGCNGGGACNFCGGDGVCYTCDGRGMGQGCPDCSKVAAN